MRLLCPRILSEVHTQSPGAPRTDISLSAPLKRTWMCPSYSQKSKSTLCAFDEDIVILRTTKISNNHDVGGRRQEEIIFMDVLGCFLLRRRILTESGRWLFEVRALRLAILWASERLVWLSIEDQLTGHPMINSLMSHCLGHRAIGQCCPVGGTPRETW